MLYSAEEIINFSKTRSLPETAAPECRAFYYACCLAIADFQLGKIDRDEAVAQRNAAERLFHQDCRVAEMDMSTIHQLADMWRDAEALKIKFNKSPDLETAQKLINMIWGVRE